MERPADHPAIPAPRVGVLLVNLGTPDEELISGRLRSIDGVQSTETFMYLRLHKQTYSWGVR